jgi:glucosyl-dolichyl phosphate glucuronosyltransferase
LVENLGTVFVTVAICTWNRAALLDKTLAEMCRMRIPDGVEWELLVVNNNCTDSTDEVLARYGSRLPLRRLFESKPGQSSARNTAIQASRGDMILWTDDDALVHEDWLAAYCRAFAKWPDAAIFGGPVDPWFEGTPPHWLTRIWGQVAGAYATREIGSEPIEISRAVVPFGVNMAFRTAEQSRFLYDPDLGLRPGSDLRGDETTLIRAMLKAGVTGRWVPDARVRHFIPAHRQSIRYLRKFFRGQGEFSARDVPSLSGPHWFGKPRCLWRKAIEAECKYRFHRIRSGPEVWIQHLIQAGVAWGEVKGYAKRVDSIHLC